MRFFKGLITCLAFVFTVAQTAVAQDSIGAIKNWTVESKKIADGKYELTFSGNINGNWQVYAPNQTILDIKTTELQFADSSIVQIGDFVLEGTPKEINSAILENTKVSVFENSIKWKATISIQGTVPEILQATLFYTYGINDEFYPSTMVPVTTKLEGGVKAASIKIPSIDINDPVSNCGDDGTKNKSLLTIFLLGLVGGLIALLTPCVFPMIPVTVTFSALITMM